MTPLAGPHHFRFVRFNGSAAKKTPDGLRPKGGHHRSSRWRTVASVLSVRRLSGNFNKTFDAGGELTFSIKCRQLPKKKKKWIKESRETAECQQLICQGDRIGGSKLLYSWEFCGVVTCRSFFLLTVDYDDSWSRRRRLPTPVIEADQVPSKGSSLLFPQGYCGLLYQLQQLVPQ